MKAIMIMYDSLNRHMLPGYAKDTIPLPNFQRLAEKTLRFNTCYVGSMPCMPARRELHTGRYNFLHRSWGPLEPFDDSMPEILGKNGIYTHLISDHIHYWEDGGATYHQRYNSWEIVRGQEADKWAGIVNADICKKPCGITFPDQERSRMLIREEKDFPQMQTFAHGMDFLERNVNQDNWFLQLETFDPHEPFYASEKYKEKFGLHDDCDWPKYGHRSEWPKDELLWYDGEMKKHYEAVLSMCDDNLGKVLDFMDIHDMWKDTLLIVNTDHGFLLGEHDFTGKCFMPFFEEVSHIPLYVWDPRVGKKGQTRNSLVQTIDLAPTLLEFFGVKIPEDMQGKSLLPVVEKDEKIHDSVLFGRHGETINITDGRYVFMLAPDVSKKFYEYTLMPTHMNCMFFTEELKKATLAPAFSFTKECPVLKVEGVRRWRHEENKAVEAYQLVDRLYDLQADPSQKVNIAQSNPRLADTFREKIQQELMKADAPEEMFPRYGMNGSFDK